MKQRYNLPDTDPDGFNELLKLETFMEKIEWIAPYKYLIKIRASQLNKCAYCLNMHSKEALENGETANRIILLNAWKEATVFGEKEKIVLEFTEHFTLVSQAEFNEGLFQQASDHFDNKQVAQLVMAIGMINLWNRIVICSGIK
ncbi:carboxymuconolactone decarboxylase family protein [Chryseobacterium echinoideorum]|uniref:carboxymuconolactone decarboxylase family protein n=1 Tax=Chryseobacterium echinoideorum TaxID=1549648 RepID=UPI0011855042|nr:carboxymuconolactone decarboxylase family protein [Chryseobacterium echinoideorum]